MAGRPVRDFTIGSLFALALVVVALGVMVVGGESGLFLERAEYTVVFPDATGLLRGAPVRMAGVEVGTVADIRLPKDAQGEGILVAVSVDPAYAERIRTDSRAALRVLQLLTNEKFVEIIPGSPGSPSLAPGSEIPLMERMSVMERGESIAEELNEITASLKNILRSLEQGEGLLGQMLHDPEFGERGLESLGRTLANLQELTEDLREGRGVAGRLLTDDALASRLDDLAVAIESFSSVMRAVEEGQGAFGALLAEGGAGQQAVSDMREAAGALRRLAERLERQEGLLGRLLYDPEYSERVAGDLAATQSNAAEITRKINEGEGTLGALVNERVLYDGAEDIVAGVNDSKYARWLARHYRKKGVVAQEAEAEEEGQDPGAEGP
jgi:phospholipid/cholesterol/gamma-HCH transport system substrate-binding protein